MRRKHLWLASMSLVTTLGLGLWYIFVAGAPQLDPPIAEAQTNLNFQVETMTSPAMGMARKYGVVLPPGYQPHGKIRYPVVILLHGGHGTERDYEDKAKLTSVLHDLYAAHKLPPAIVVTPDGNDERGSSPLWDPNYYNGKHGKVDTLIGQELVQEIKTHYHVSEYPADWAIGGLSSGGWGALNIGLRHLDTFQIFFSHTGYFVDRSGTQNSPEKFIQQLPQVPLSQIKVYLDAGQDDHHYLNATQSFHDVLLKLGITHEFHAFPGGHGVVGENVGWNYWHKHLYDSLSFVGKYFQANQAQPHQSAHILPKSHPIFLRSSFFTAS